MALGLGVVLFVLGLDRVDDVAPRLSLVTGEVR
jgi:hypothetical protein